MEALGGTSCTLDEAIAGADGRALLLVFWAPWHVRSRNLLADATLIAKEHADELALFSVNVDLGIETAMRFSMRAVPLIILLREGREVARTAGPTGSEGLLPWLWCQGVARASIPADFEPPRELGAAGSFHGDTDLRERLLGRLRELAARQAIVCRRFPFWCDGQGTISCALAGSNRPDIIEAQTGLPFSFACALEFLGLEWSENVVDEIFSALPVGVDLSKIAIRLVHSHLADPDIDWPAIIDDPQLNALRSQWLHLIDRHVCGIDVSAAEWDEVLLGLGMLRSQGRNPERTVQDSVIDMLCTLSPPPVHDDDLWASALSLHGTYLLHVVVQYDLGWTRSDFAFEGERGLWFIARERLEPGGYFSDSRLHDMQQEWMRLRGAEQIRYDQMLAESSANLPLLSNRMRQRLSALLRESAVCV